MKEFKYDLGIMVTDSVTNIAGKIMARAQYLYSENMYLLECAEKDGYWVHEPRIFTTWNQEINLRRKKNKETLNK